MVMKLISKINDQLTIEMSKDELSFLSNAINETLEAVDEFEFQTRTGGTSEEAKHLMTELGEILRQS